MSTVVHRAGSFELDREWERRIQLAWWASGLRARVITLCEPHDEHHMKGLNDLANSPPHGEARYAFSVQDSAHMNLTPF